LEALERGGEFAGPGPRALDAQGGGAGVERETGGDVEESVAQAFGFGFGEFAGQQEALGPGDQVVRDPDQRSQTWLWSKWWNGRLRSPVSLSLRMWSSTRARPR
jgi:hypothetical protein